MSDAPLPSRVVGALVDYDVLVVDRVDDLDSAGEHNSLSVPATIRIKASLPEHWRWQTLWHELLHMLEEEQLVDLSEDEVERLAVGLCALWRRNEWVQPANAQREDLHTPWSMCCPPHCHHRVNAR